MGFVLHIGNSKKLHVSTTNKIKPTNLIIKINLFYGKIGETWQNKTKMKKKERKQREIEREMKRDIMKGKTDTLKLHEAKMRRLIENRWCLSESP